MHAHGQADIDVRLCCACMDLRLRACTHTACISCSAGLGRRLLVREGCVRAGSPDVLPPQQTCHMCAACVSLTLGQSVAPAHSSSSNFLLVLLLVYRQSWALEHCSGTFILLLLPPCSASCLLAIMGLEHCSGTFILLLLPPCPASCLLAIMGLEHCSGTFILLLLPPCPASCLLAIMGLGTLLRHMLAHIPNTCQHEDTCACTHRHTNMLAHPQHMPA